MSSGRERRRKQRRREAKQSYVDVGLEELVAIVERTKEEPLSAEERLKLKAAVETLAFVLEELRNKSASLARLRVMLFGLTTEKTSQVFGEEARPGERDASEGAGAKEPRGKRPGHGRNGAAALTGAERVKVPHPSLHGGEHCPGCQKGRVYPLQDPAVLVRITGNAPLRAAVYERDRLRCNLCGEVFTAPSPEGVGEEKYWTPRPGAWSVFSSTGRACPSTASRSSSRAWGFPCPRRRNGSWCTMRPAISPRPARS